MTPHLPRDFWWGVAWVLATWLLAIAATAMLVAGLASGAIR